MNSTVLQRLQEPGRQTSIATELGLGESTISRLKTDHLENLCKVLALAGLKIVPVEVKCFREEDVDALITLAKGRLDQVENSRSLVWE